jgi:hypothetical protein
MQKISARRFEKSDWSKRKAIFKRFIAYSSEDRANGEVSAHTYYYSNPFEGDFDQK